MPAIRVSKGSLKARMLEYFREVERTGTELIVLDHNKPVLRITAIEREKNTAGEVFRKDRGKIKYHEDINAPTTDEWGDT
ncbi:MAG: prevent-host-death protein [Deltaproteobacteria bacterium]|nr:prevent-host-death protein [Deltaproteobacteria bacterium]